MEESKQANAARELHIPVDVRDMVHSITRQLAGLETLIELLEAGDNAMVDASVLEPICSAVRQARLDAVTLSKCVNAMEASA